MVWRPIAGCISNDDCAGSPDGKWLREPIAGCGLEISRGVSHSRSRAKDDAVPFPALLLGTLTLAWGHPALAQTADVPASASPPEITVTGRARPAPVLVGPPVFISPMGEPFRSQDALSGAEHWFAQASHDGALTRDEFRADAARFFATLDTDRDAMLGPDEIDRYETEIAPEVRVLSTYGDASLARADSDGTVKEPPYPTRLGAGRYGYLGMPEPVVYADINFDRAISRQEFEQTADRRFAMLDTNGDGNIAREELPKLGRAPGDDDHP